MLREASASGRNGWHSEAIIADTLNRGPEIALDSSDGRWRFSRWRQFVGSYALPALPDPMFVVQLAGKTNVRTWDRDGWSTATSFPGAATIVPAAMPTRWLVDGELDVVTLSVDSSELRSASAFDQFTKMQFAFNDTLGAALARQILAELYSPVTGARDTYVSALIDALKAHMMRGPAKSTATEFPTSAFSSHRLHQIINRITERPEDGHSLEDLAHHAGITPSHLCRVFKRATNLSLHQFVLKTRLERAQQMLGRSEIPIHQIAERLGFNSHSAFNRAFRNFTGETPSGFRARRLGHQVA